MSEHLDKYRSLAEKLLMRTRESKINWSWAPDDQRITSKIGKQYVELHKGANANFEDLYSVTILGPTGFIVDAFTDEEIGGIGVLPSIVLAENYFSVMGSLYELAYRQSIGADKALDTLLSSLDDESLGDEVPF